MSNKEQEEFKEAEKEKAIKGYVEYCKTKDFLLSKAVAKDKDGRKTLQAISEAKVKLEMNRGAKMGANPTRKYLEERGFKDNVPLGAGKITLNEELSLHHGDYHKDVWVGMYKQYAAATKYGVLILAKTLENFQHWAKSNACAKEVNQIPTGRLFAYVENDYENGYPQGYIVHVDAQNKMGSATVENGKGYLIFADGNCYDGDLKGGHRNGKGTLTWADGRKYVGEYKDDNMHGQGTFTWASGNEYVGEWKDDNMHGKGTKTFKSGKIESGVWENDKFVG